MFSAAPVETIPVSSSRQYSAGPSSRMALLAEVAVCGVAWPLAIMSMPYGWTGSFQMATSSASVSTYVPLWCLATMIGRVLATLPTVSAFSETSSPSAYSVAVPLAWSRTPTR